MKVIISACLLGIACNYKQETSSSWNEALSVIIQDSISKGIEFIPVCPEQLGGLPTPRPPAELKASAREVITGNGRIVNVNGLDVTANFIQGAKQAFELSKLFNVKFAILKSKSPSCGINSIYDGNFSGTLVEGPGVTARLFLDNDLIALDDVELLEKWKCTGDVSSVFASLSK